MKKAISLLLSVVIAFSVVVPGFMGINIPGISQLGESTIINAEAATSRAPDALATVFTASDFQDSKAGNDVEANFAAMIRNAMANGSAEPDGFILGGDYESSYANAHSTPLAYRRVEGIITDIFPYYDKRNIIALQGNHDKNDTSVLDDTGLYEFEHYLVYVISNEDYPAGTGGASALAKTQATAEKLVATFDKLLAEGETRPIFIATHIPLHHNSRNPKAANSDGSYGYNETLYSKVLFDAIQGYATVFDVIFFFGHNHSGSYDDYIGGAVNYIAKGDKIRIPDYSQSPSATSYTEETLNFTYMNYGYVGYSNNTVDKTLTMGAFEICPDRIELTRYSANGVYSEHTITRNLKLNHESVSVAGYGSGTVGSATGALATATGFTDPVYTWTSSNNNVAKINATGRTAQIHYNQAGTATVTVTVTERNDSSKTATDSYSVTVTNDARAKVATIRVATQLVAQSEPDNQNALIGLLEYYNVTYGKEVSLVGSFEGFAANAANVSWESSDPSVATVENGVVKLVGGGTTFIRYTVTDSSTTLTAQVKFVVSNAPKIQYVYEEVDNTTFSAGKKYVIVTTRTTNYVHKDTLDSSGSQGVTFYSNEVADISTSSPRTINISDDVYVWKTVATGTDGVYYLQNEATGMYLSTAASSTGSDRGDFVLQSSQPSASDGGWRIATNKNLWNGKYYWYTRGTGHTNLITSEKANYVALFERKALNPSATIDFRGEDVNGTTQTLYSVTDSLQVPAYGLYTNIEEVGSETWTSSNTSVVTVDSNGILSFKGVAGTSLITYTVTDAKSGQSYRASFTIEANLGAEATRTFKYAKTITPGKNYIIVDQIVVGTGLALTSFQVSNEKLLADRVNVQVNSSNEYFVNIPSNDSYPVWTPESAGSGTYYLKNEADGSYFYAYTEGADDGYGGMVATVFTSESYATNPERYTWTYTGTKLYNNSAYTGSDVTYVRIRSGEYPGAAKESQSKIYFYEEVDAEPNGIITLRYNTLGATYVRDEICPGQTETFVPKAENFPDNNQVDYRWASDNDEVATIDPVTGVITYTGKSGNVNITLTSTSKIYAADSTKPVDETTVKLIVNGGAPEVPEDPGSGDQPEYVEGAFYKTTKLVPGKKYVLHTNSASASTTNLAISNVNKSGLVRLLCESVTAPVTDETGEYIITTDSSVIWECVESDVSGYYKLRNTETGEYLFTSESESTSAKHQAGVTTDGVHPEASSVGSAAGDTILLKYDSTNSMLYSKQVVESGAAYGIGNVAKSSSGYFYIRPTTPTSSGSAPDAITLYGEPEEDTSTGGGTAPVGEVYYLTDSFVVGEKYLIANSKTADDSNAHVMSNQYYSENKVLKAISATVGSYASKTYIVNPGSDAAVFEAVDSGVDGYVKLKSANGKYLVMAYYDADGNKLGSSDRLVLLADEGEYPENQYLFRAGYSTSSSINYVGNNEPAYLHYSSGTSVNRWTVSSGYGEVYVYAFDEETSTEANPVTQVRKTDYFGSVNITNVTQYRYDIDNGDTEQLYRYVVDVQDGYTYNWTSSDTSIATINSSTGLITFKGKDGHVAFTLTVTGKDLTGKDVNHVVSTTYKVSTDPYQMSTDDYPEYPDEGSVRINKTASNAAGGTTFQESGVTEVELGVTGVPVSTPVDVVIVLDHSESMNDKSKLITAINDTRNFALQIFNANENNRVAIVTFDQFRNHYESIDSTTMKNTSSGNEDKIVTGDGSVKNAFVGADQVDNVASSLDSLAVNSVSGTNYDSGLNYAYKILEYAKTDPNANKNQVVVFMSDGEPTKFNGLKLSDTTEGTLSYAWIMGDETHAELSTYLADTTTYPAAALFNTNGDNWFAAAIKTPEGQNVEGMPNISFYDGYHTGLGAKIYTIGYHSSTKAAKVLSTIASDPANYYSASTNLQGAYDRILEQIIYAASNAVVTDKMGDHFDVQFATSFSMGGSTVTLNPVPKFEIGYWTLDNIGNRISYNVIETITFTTNANGILTGAESSVVGSCYDSDSSTINGQYVSYNLNTETFTWTIGEINRNEITLKYYACLEGAANGAREAGTFDTNKVATLSYTNYRGSNCSQTFPVPTLAWKQAAVSYDFYLVNAQGQPINRQGVVVPFSERVLVGREQTKKLLLNSDVEVSAYNLIAQNEIPEGYNLFNEDALYRISVSSIDGQSSAVIQDSTLTTYYRDGSYVTNANGEVPNVSDYFNTAVSFAVTYTEGIVPDSIVIDYGLPVKISVLGNDYAVSGGTITAVGKTLVSGTILNSMAYTSSRLTDAATSGLVLTYGNASVDGDYVVYTPTSTAMGGEEVFYYEYKTADGKYYYAKVTIIPAANIYYEESFMEFVDGNGYSWTDVGTEITGKFQAEDRPGTFSFAEYDAGYTYGEDPAYDDSVTYSLGNAKKATVDYYSAGKEPVAKFTFCGTGFDLFSVTNNDTGAVIVTIYQAGTKTIYKNFIVNTYYGYKVTDGTLLPDLESTKGLYQVPIVSRRDLDYGTYDVVIKPIYSSAFDPNYTGYETTANAYSIYVDSVRIFNPAGAGGDVSDVVGDAYLKDGEFAPKFMEIRDTVLSSQEYYDQTIEDLELGYSGSLFLDGNTTNGIDGTGITTYKTQGPNNELYLGKNQAVAFMVSSEDADALASLQLGMKVVSGGGTAEVVIMNTSEKSPNTITVSGAHETFKSLSSAVVWNQSKITYDENNVYETLYPIVIANTSDTVVSLTTFKWAHTTPPESGESTLDFMVYDTTPMMATMALRNAMASVEEPEETETYDVNDVSIEWAGENFTEGEEATLKVTTPAAVVGVTVGGIDVTGCEIDDNGNKIWTYTFVLVQSGENEFEVILYDYNDEASEPMMTETIYVEEAKDEPATDESEPEPDDSVTDPPSDGSEGEEPEEEKTNLDKAAEFIKELFSSVLKFLRSVITFIWRFAA